MGRSRVCRHEEGLLLFLGRADVHLYVIWELELSPDVLRAAGPHLHWEFFRCRSAAGVAAVMVSEAAKIYHCLVCFFSSFMTRQILVLAYCGATQGGVGTKGRRESLTGESGRLDYPLQLQLWLGQPQENPSYSISFACQETKEAWLKNEVQQNVKRPFSTTGHLSSVLSILALICTWEVMQHSSPPPWLLWIKMQKTGEGDLGLKGFPYTAAIALGA